MFGIFKLYLNQLRHRFKLQLPCLKIGAGKSYTHQSMFWSDLGPDVGYEAIGKSSGLYVINH